MNSATTTRADVSLIARAVLAYLATDPDGPTPALARCFVTLALGTVEPPFVVVNDAAGETLAVYQVRDIGEGKTMLKRRKSRVGLLAWPSTCGEPARLTGYAWGGWEIDFKAGIPASPKHQGGKNALQPEGKKRRAR